MNGRNFVEIKTMQRFLVIIAAAICLAVPAAARKKKAKKSNPAALALFKKAIAASDIEAKGSPAFRLQAEVRIHNGAGVVTGMVIEFWTPGHLQRTETMLAGYNSLTVMNGKDSWTKTSTKYAPYPVGVAWSILDFVGVLQPVVKAATHPPRTRLKLRVRVLKNLPGETKHHKKSFAKCVYTGSGRQAARYCFAYPTGHLVEEKSAPPGLSYYFSNYQPFGDKTFPRKIRVDYAGGHEMLEVDVIKIDRMTKPDPKLFAALPGVKEQPSGEMPGSEEQGSGKGCPGVPQTKRVKMAKLIKQVMPVYPKKAKRDRVSGTVVFHAMIGADGTVHALWPLMSPSSLLTASAFAAVRQWRYRPTMLCGQPVGVYTTITVVYTLGP